MITNPWRVYTLHAYENYFVAGQKKKKTNYLEKGGGFLEGN